MEIATSPCICIFICNSTVNNNNAYYIIIALECRVDFHSSLWCKAIQASFLLKLIGNQSGQKGTHWKNVKIIICDLLREFIADIVTLQLFLPLHNRDDLTVNDYNWRNKWMDGWLMDKWYVLRQSAFLACTGPFREHNTNNYNVQ